MPDKQRAEFPQRWLLWRREFKTHWRSLEVHEAWALEQACTARISPTSAKACSNGLMPNR